MGDHMIPALLLMRGECVIKTMFMGKNFNQVSKNVRKVYLGRDTICCVALEEEDPSVAGFHLLLELNRATHTVHITDFGTEFGTWISEKKMEPNVRQIFGEDAILRLGNSPRLYKLQWLPAEFSINGDGKFVPQLQGSVAIYGGAKVQQRMTLDTKLWYVVADISCLLSEEARHILEIGLRTPRPLPIHLVLPYHAVSELGRIRIENQWLTERASHALEWIHEMLREGRLHLQGAHQRVSIDGNPSYVLECGLFLKNNIKHGGVVIATNDAALKIVGESIGFECETMNEFHASLANRYSKRFLYPSDHDF